MDNLNFNLENFIKKITREVTEALTKSLQDNKNELAYQPAYESAAIGNLKTSGKGLAILWSGHPYDDEEAHKTITSLLETSISLKYLLAPDLERRFGKLFPYDLILSVTNQHELASYYENCSFLLIPLLPYWALGKLSLLTGEDGTFLIVLKALQEKKPVYVISPSWGTDAQLNKNVMAKEIVNYKKQLANLGIKMISDHRLLRDSQHLLQDDLPQDGKHFTQKNQDVTQGNQCFPQDDRCSACGHCTSKMPESIRQILQSGACRIGTALGTPKLNEDVAKYIDHTLLKPDATKEQVIQLCDEAKQYGFASVCVNPSYVTLAAEELKGTPVRVCTVIGFPLGALRLHWQR